MNGGDEWVVVRTCFHTESLSHNFHSCSVRSFITFSCDLRSFSSMFFSSLCYFPIFPFVYLYFSLLLIWNFRILPAFFFHPFLIPNDTILPFTMRSLKWKWMCNKKNQSARFALIISTDLNLRAQLPIRLLFIIYKAKLPIRMHGVII